MSLYDLDASLGGEQPNGYDAWTAFYSNYLVSKVTLTVQYENLEDQCVGVTVLPSRYSNNAGTYTSSLGKPGIKHFIVPQQGSGRNVISRTYTWTALELYRLRSELDNDPRYLASKLVPVASDPDVLVHLVGQVWRTDEVAGNINGVMRYTLVCHSTMQGRTLFDES